MPPDAPTYRPRPLGGALSYPRVPRFSLRRTWMRHYEELGALGWIGPPNGTHELAAEPDLDELCFRAKPEHAARHRRSLGNIGAWHDPGGDDSLLPAYCEEQKDLLGVRHRVHPRIAPAARREITQGKELDLSVPQSDERTGGANVWIASHWFFYPHTIV